MPLETGDKLLITQGVGGKPVCFPCLPSVGGDKGILVLGTDGKLVMCKGVAPENGEPLFIANGVDGGLVGMKAVDKACREENCAELKDYYYYFGGVYDPVAPISMIVTGATDVSVIGLSGYATWDLPAESGLEQCVCPGNPNDEYYMNVKNKPIPAYTLNRRVQDLGGFGFFYESEYFKDSIPNQDESLLTISYNFSIDGTPYSYSAGRVLDEFNEEMFDFGDTEILPVGYGLNNVIDSSVTVDGVTVAFHYEFTDPVIYPG